MIVDMGKIRAQGPKSEAFRGRAPRSPVYPPAGSIFRRVFLSDPTAVKFGSDAGSIASKDVGIPDCESLGTVQSMRDCWSNLARA